ASLAWGIADLWSRCFLVAHFGLFLLWQPVWRGERNVESRYAFLVIIVGVMVALGANGWLLAVWLAVLFGLIGGSLPGVAARRRRLVAVLAALSLLSMRRVWVVPHLFPGPVLEDAMVLFVRYGLPVVPFTLIAIRVEQGRTQAPV